MKKIRKLFLTVVLLAVCVCCLISFTACDTLNADDWKEVQSITYTTESDSKTLTSKCVWDAIYTRIEKDEYDSAPEGTKWMTDSLFIGWNELPKDRNGFKSSANNVIGNTSYYCVGDYIYQKVTYNSYELNYVKIKFNKNGSLDVDFEGHITTVLPITYEITYFEN